MQRWPGGSPGGDSSKVARRWCRGCVAWPGEPCQPSRAGVLQVWDVARRQDAQGETLARRRAASKLFARARNMASGGDNSRRRQSAARSKPRAAQGPLARAAAGSLARWLPRHANNVVGSSRQDDAPPPPEVCGQRSSHHREHGPDHTPSRPSAPVHHPCNKNNHVALAPAHIRRPPAARRPRAAASSAINAIRAIVCGRAERGHVDAPTAISAANLLRCYCTRACETARLSAQQPQ